MTHWLLRPRPYRPGRKLLGLLLVFGLFAFVFLCVGLIGLVVNGPRRAPASVVDKLRSRNLAYQKAGLRELAATPPDRSRRDIAAALLHLVLKGYHSVRLEAARELGLWGQPEDAKALAPLVLNNHWAEKELRQVLIGTLGDLGGPDAYELLGERLTHTDDEKLAGTALKQIGPDAEPAVLAVLEHPGADTESRLAALGVLRSIGSERSVPALRRFADDNNTGPLNEAARTAIKEIEDRVKKP